MPVLPALVVTYLFVVVAGNEEDGLVVNTTSGLIQGKLLNRTRVFRGVPFAAPPVGDLRWRPPQDHPRWTGVRKTQDFGASCMQPWSLIHGKKVGGWNTINVTNMAEDCLTLNIYTPQNASSQQLPVMLYLHAGEFHLGSSNDAENNWPYFSPHGDVILVTSNARIGVFGFLGTNLLRSRAPNKGTGNYGVLDQRFAMRWVHENIAAFGGDPKRVSIWGESSGGTSVAYHLASKESWPYFQQAILESPGLTQVKSMGDAEQNAEYVLAALAAQGSPHCPAQYGKWKAFQSDTLYGNTVKVIQGLTVADASWCCDNSQQCGFKDCTAFTIDNLMNYTVFYDYYFIYDISVQSPGVKTSYVRPGPSGEAAIQCLLSADPRTLNQMTEAVARDDTFATDAFAPVIDGVDLKEAILDTINGGRLAPHVNILLGSNLDEGTEFMAETPRLNCNASNDEFAKWAEHFYGGELGIKVTTLYKKDSLVKPVPLCSEHSDCSNAIEGGWYASAMRSAGDFAILCPTRELARSVAAMPSSRVFVYFFTHTPKYSANDEGLKCLGAFHGSEVPFAFHDGFELSTSEERSLSVAMGCYWRSFAIYGDPNHDVDCSWSKSQSRPTWPQYTSGDDSYLQLNATHIHKITGLQEEQCDHFRDSRWRRKSSPELEVFV